MARWDAAWFGRLDRELAELPFLEDDAASAVRRALASDPVAFAMLYLDHHLRDRNGRITWGVPHFEWAREALNWTTMPDQPAEQRTAEIAPRECGKSTWWFLILPLWAAVNGYSTFTVAFAHAASQAETHLATMRHEIETNVLLRADFPEHTEPAVMRSGSTKADRAGMIHMRSGWVFAARGIDSAVLGMKVGDRRPDLIILDDVEPDEANYSALQAEKRLGTITDAILPLNLYARVVFVGTVTMPGSIMHQLVKAAHGVIEKDHNEWVLDTGIRARHFRPFHILDDGREVSIWPQKWPTAWLQSQRHTRSFAKNYENDPMAREGVYWVREDFQHGLPLRPRTRTRYEPGRGLIEEESLEVRRCTRTALYVDPAVTTGKYSDFTGLAVIGYMPKLMQRIAGGLPRTVAEAGCLIKHSAGVKLTGRHLRDHVAGLLAQFPEIREIVVESNQGGDLWSDVFGDLPQVKIRQQHSTVSKEVRFATALDFWQAHRVWHAVEFPTLEEQAVGFPRAPYDDVVDAACTGVLDFLDPPAKITVSQSSRPYAGR